MFKKIASIFLTYALINAPLYAVAQTINPSAPAQAGTGLSQAGSTLNVLYGTTANTAKEGNAVSSIAQGGTGLSNVPSNDLLLGNGTSPLSLLAPSATTGQVLTTTGAGLIGWATPPTAAVSSVFGQTGAIPNLSGVIATSGSSVTTFSPGGTSGQFLTSNGATAPSWQTYTPPVTSVFAQTGAVPNLSGVVTTSGSSTTSFSPAGSAGQVLMSNGASAPTFQNAVNSVFTQTGVVPNLSGAVTTSGSSVTAFGAGGSTGQVLMSNGASPATFQNLPTASSSASPSVLGNSATFTASSATATISARYTTMVSNGGQGISVASPSASVNISTTGAGGMDTGTAPASGYVAIYFIYNQGTSTLNTLAVNATSATVPEVYGGANMPAGYGYSALVTVVPTNAGATFSGAIANGRNVYLNPITLTTAGTSGAYASLSISSFVPHNANVLGGSIVVGATGGGGNLHIASNSLGYGDIECAGSNSINACPFALSFVNSQSIYYQTNGSGSITITGSFYGI